jgi:hypothetical protein
MKKLLSGLAMLGALLSLHSCSKTIYTHDQVMQSYRTKAAVEKQFGLPDEIREANNTTEWLYNCDATSIFGRSKAQIAINGSDNRTVDSLNARSLKVTQFTNYFNYAKFTFDPQGIVISWDSHGVNFAKKKKNTVGTILLVAGAAGALAFLVTAVVATIDLSSAFTLTF